MTEDGPGFDATLLVHDAGVVLHVTEETAVVLAGGAEVSRLAAWLGLGPVLEEDPSPATAPADRAWVQTVQGPAVLVLRREGAAGPVFVGLGELPETARYLARLTGHLRLDVCVTDADVLPTLTWRGLVRLSGQGRAWTGQVATTEAG
ncbi:MAG TPA: hypothetical protein VFL46_08965 [Phycicoccus sp.]|nr:hypothetical protein [Phycicoccus sp.]